MIKKAKVLIVDDHPVVREGLKLLISQEDDLEAWREAGSGREALEILARGNTAAVVLDISLGDMNGIQLMKTLRNLYPDLPVLILSMHEENLYAERALRAGALGYIMKDEASENLIHALRRILTGEIYVSETMASKLLKTVATGSLPGEWDPLSRLTDRELEVFERLGRGKGVREIAAHLHISLKTVESHCSHIKEKLDLESMRELTMHAVRWGSGGEPAAP